jgi:hypothetical protein
LQLEVARGVVAALCLLWCPGLLLGRARGGVGAVEDALPRIRAGTTERDEMRCHEHSSSERGGELAAWQVQ